MLLNRRGRKQGAVWLECRNSDSIALGRLGVGAIKRQNCLLPPAMLIGHSIAVILHRSVAGDTDSKCANYPGLHASNTRIIRLELQRFDPPSRA